jgi:hypothetical protein
VPDQEEFNLHTMAVIAARKAASLPLPTPSIDARWWSEGPHLEMDGRSYYVHAMGCLQSELGQAIHKHPEWYLVGAVVRGDSVQLHGLDESSAVTLGEVGAAGEALSPDEVRLAVEFTPAEKRAWWGVVPPDKTT